MGRTLLQVTNLTKAFGQRTLFSDLNVSINANERIALVGPNGVGKTTLARIVLGLEPATSGEVRPFSETLVTGYLPQTFDLPTQGTARSLLEAEAQGLGTAVRCSVPEALGLFGFSDREASLPLSQLSGGQKSRLLLARCWLSVPDLLVLDEPTNHVDLEGCEHLAQTLSACPCTVLVISHDRYFLDQVVTRVLELSSTGLADYSGNYGDYRRQKLAALESQARRYQKEQKQIRQLEDNIARQMRWLQTAHRGAGQNDYYRARAKKTAARVKATVKRLERMRSEATAKPRAERSVSLDFSADKHHGHHLLIAEGVGKAYARLLFRHADFAVQRGDRIGVVGPNGAGKTTLLRVLLGLEPPTWGKVWRSPSLRPGFLEQELDHLRGQTTVLDSVLSVLIRIAPEHHQRVRHMLALFLFSRSDWDKPLAVLSEGERRRVALVRLLLSDYNMLVLDEPTNHLDISARERVEEALQAYDGTMIVVTHDRYLMENVCDKILAITDGRVVMYPGTYGEYLARKSEVKSSVSDQALSDEERLLLENRRAWLAAQLSSCLDAEQTAKMEEEFMKISRALRDHNLK
ncbi:MAG: ribosomal protection-like ABC-F family protein [Limnochordia bacterium]